MTMNVGFLAMGVIRYRADIPVVFNGPISHEVLL